MFSALLIGFIALGLALQAATVSVSGMTAIFPSGGLTVIILIGSLEFAKVVCSGVLKLYWNFIPLFLKWFIVSCIVILMSITSLGVYARLAKSHIDDASPRASTDLQIAQLQQRVDQVKADRASLDDRRKQIDASITSLINNAKTSKESQASQKVLTQQKKDKDNLQKQINDDDTQINALTDKLLPLKLSNTEVEKKLGPILFISSALGIQNPDSAVNVIIILLTVCFDPLAVALSILAVMLFQRHRKEKLLRRVQEVILEPPSTSAVYKPIEEHVNLNSVEPEHPIKEEPTIETIEKIQSPIIEKQLSEPENNKPTNTILGSSLNSNTKIVMETTNNHLVPVMETPKTEVNWLLNNENYNPKTDQELFLEILERRPDLLQNVVDTVEEMKEKEKELPMEFVEEPDEQKIDQASKSWLNQPWFPNNK